MVARIKTVAFLGVDAVGVDVQVHLAPGHNAFTVVGLPDKSVAESRERVRAALSAMGLALPYERITINLSPADLPKEGSHCDLPIALGLLVAMGGLTHDQVAPFVAMGELALDGACTPVPGALPAAMAEMMGSPKGEASAVVAARVGAAREVQMARQNCLNAHLDGEALYKLAAPDTAGQSLLDRIADTKKLSARGFNRILRVARTLADLDHRDMPGAENVATAIRWRDIAF